MLLSSLTFLFISLVNLSRSASVNPDTLATFERIAGYAGAAYCSSNHVTGVNGPTIFPPNIYDSNGATTIAYSFLKVDERKTTGLIMLDHAHKALVITFRGTISDADWETNLEFVLEDASDVCGKGCKAHAGFFASWRGVSDIVTTKWRALSQQYPQYSTIITGHSLGGAIAHLCAAGLKTVGPNAAMSLYSYASPRVGNEVFASFINQRFGANIYRFTHLDDPIPRLPGRLLGFVHTSPEYFITSPHIRKVLSAGKKTLAKPENVVVQAGDIHVLAGPENEAGNVGYQTQGQKPTIFDTLADLFTLLFTALPEQEDPS
ncbi:uncharacterized protein LTR77_009558 [Saxophila tyrrhenica]|uniref:Fungal lipase-type domain-containing protein n=1 Tax=Saxophila tyrrhenica TaxID=1690608 RepID=A0AAV9P1E9_9PEZI|nr:hypothetical protein LTR77_009558 [Saxophila tyrrhenica]